MSLARLVGRLDRYSKELFMKEAEALGLGGNKACLKDVCPFLREKGEDHLEGRWGLGFFKHLAAGQALVPSNDPRISGSCRQRPSRFDGPNV